jgi:hypothetical protein
VAGSRAIHVMTRLDRGGKEAVHMKVFTIDADNNITVHASRKAARETGAGVFTTAATFAELIGSDSQRLVEVWNSLTGVKLVKKFTSREIAAQRIFSHIQKLEPEATASDSVEAPSEEHAAPVVKTAKAKRAAKAEAAQASMSEPTSKKDLILTLVSRTEGVTLEDIMTATAWQAHSVRGFIATLNKKGTKIESFKSEAGVRTYKAA